MEKVTCRYLGDKRCESIHERTGVRIMTDGDHDRARPEHVSPTELVAVALGNCMMSIAGYIGEREGVDLSDMRLEIEQEMTAGPGRRIGRQQITIHMPPGLSDKQRRKMETGIQTCPVHHSLSEQIERPVAFRYPD